MYRFIPLIVPVNNQIKIVSILRDQCNELFASFSDTAQVIHQRQIPVRRESIAVRLVQTESTAHKQLHQPGQFFLAERQRKTTVNFSICLNGQVTAIHISNPLRQKNLCPFAIFADHLDFSAVRQLCEGSVLHSRASADIQISAIGCNNPYLGAIRFFPGRIVLAFLSRLSATNHNAVFCHRDLQRVS